MGSQWDIPSQGYGILVGLSSGMENSRDIPVADTSTSLSQNFLF